MIADVDDEPAKVLKLLDDRYTSYRAVSRIAVQRQLYLIRYKEQDISKHVDEYIALFSQLHFMGETVVVLGAHEAPMLLVSINPKSTMEPITNASHNKNADDLIWDYVATTLIDEFNARHTDYPHLSPQTIHKLKKNVRKNVSNAHKHEGKCSLDESWKIRMATRAFVSALRNLNSCTKKPTFDRCTFCKRGHNVNNCFLNPDSPNNNLFPKMKERMMVANDTKAKKKPIYQSRLKDGRDV